MDTSIHGVNDTIQSATISGGLIYVNSWCQAIMMTGDFNGDGRTDQLCYTTTGGVGTSKVSLAGPTQFANPTTWITNFSLTHVVIADFNSDGKSDLATHDPNDGKFRVALSNGTTAFQPPTVWGTAVGDFQGGPTVSCVGTQAVVGAGDFNGDGLTDVFCKRPYWESSYQFVGLAKNTSGTWSWSCPGLMDT